MQGFEALLACLQCLFAPSERLKQLVERSDQCVDLVGADLRERLQRTTGFAHRGQSSRRVFQRQQLSVQDPPQHAASCECQDRCRDQDAAVNVGDRSERFFCWQGRCNEPIGGRNAVGGYENLNAVGVFLNLGTTVAIKPAIGFRIDAARLQDLHVAVPVGGDDDHSLRRRDQQVSSRLAVPVPRDWVQEVRLIEPHAAAQRADDVALLVIDRYRDDDDPCVDHPAHDRRGNGRAVVAQSTLDVLPVAVIDAQSPG